MAVKNIDFDDLPEDEVEGGDKMVNVTIKMPENSRDMFSKVAHRERRNMSTLGGVVVEDYLNNYVANYEKKED